MALGLLVIAAALIAVVIQAPRTAVATNAITVTGRLGLFYPHTTICQADEPLPAATTALRLSLSAYIGPSVSVTVSHGDEILARGHQSAGWVGSSLILPLEPMVAEPQDTTICFTRDSGQLSVDVNGGYASHGRTARVDGNPLPGRMRVEYLSRGRRSWLSLTEQVARRLGLGHAPSGTWLALALTILMASAIGLTAWILLREPPYE